MDPLLRTALVATIIVAATLAGRWWQRRDGAVKSGAGGFTSIQMAKLGLTAVGDDPVAVLLGSPTCTPCDSVKRILKEVANDRPAFQWVYADAADHLDVADQHHVMRVPTLFVLDHDGRILARTSGVPAKRDIVRVLDREGDLV